jgi:hypothetical protein
MEESRRRRSCRRSRLFRRFGASRETEKNASRRDSRGSLDSRTPDRTRRRNPSFRGSDGAGRRESARRVSRFAKFFLAIERGSRMRFQSRARFFVWPKVQVSHPPRSRARSARNSPRSVNVRRFIRGFRRPARFRACAANRWRTRVHARRPRARATLPARRARRAERTTGTEVSGKEERAGCARREARASRALDV